MQIFNLIMAGGSGSRFWPLSREKNPKQLLNLSGNDVMINETIDRTKGITDVNNTIIVTNESQGNLLKKLIREKYDDFNVEHVLNEPSKRNTAAAICYGAFYLNKEYGECIMCVYPADHFIKDEVKFNTTLKKAIELASKKDYLVTIGINPTFPSTGYGYINFDIDEELMDDCYKVEEFVEKPNFNKAKEYVDSKEYLWNSGMFVWKTSKILQDFKRYLPKIYNRMEDIFNYYGTDEFEEKLKKYYSKIQSTSIDYGIMERSDDVAVVFGDFEWNDVGSWDVLGSIYKTDTNGNVKKGDIIEFDSENSIFYSNKRLITGIGLKNMIVVETNDSILVCPKERAQDVKKIVDTLKEEGRADLL